MKLAEALIRRKALKENIEQLKVRLAKVAKVQEGDTPAERPQELLAALEADLQDLQTLIIRINRTNLQATLADGTTLMEAIAKRDILKLQRGILESLASNAVPTQDRFTRTELKYIPWRWGNSARRLTASPRLIGSWMHPSRRPIGRWTWTSCCNRRSLPAVACSLRAPLRWRCEASRKPQGFRQSGSAC
jgi:hypothetical protein